MNAVRREVDGDAGPWMLQIVFLKYSCAFFSRFLISGDQFLSHCSHIWSNHIRIPMTSSFKL